jgi:hypothetical protein
MMVINHVRPPSARSKQPGVGALRRRPTTTSNIYLCIGRKSDASMAQNRDLKSNSVLFWLVALIAAGIIFIGARFLFAPLAAAEGFGVPATGTHTFA